MKKFLVFAVIGFGMHSTATWSSAATIFLDTYQTNPVGTPDIGSYFQFDGTHAVVDLGGGDKRMRSTNSSNNGFAVDAQHIMQPFVPLARVSYDIVIESGANLVGSNAFVQDAILDSPGGLGSNLFLYWGENHKLFVRKSTVGGGIGAPVETTFDWAFDQNYHVVWQIDGSNDTASLVVNGIALYTNDPLGDDFSGLQRFAFSSNFATTGSQLLDNLTITSAVPEPATSVLFTIGIACFAAWKRKQTLS